ncbi:MAG: hypothetical protein NTX89_05470 [Candidatus Omnitrophica bacterium]|nr:hypothetical protein [Candidatus Omnitrophota bacterium]
MQNNKLIVRLMLLTGFILLAFVFIYHESIRSFLQFNLHKAEVVVGNISPDTSASEFRDRPLSTLVQETELKLYFSEPFKSFSKEEWVKFWELFYGEFPREYTGEGLPEKNRQLTFNEIAQELINLYPDIFSRYQNTHWESLFQVILKK